MRLSRGDSRPSPRDSLSPGRDKGTLAAGAGRKVKIDKGAIVVVGGGGICNFSCHLGAETRGGERSPRGTTVFLASTEESDWEECVVAFLSRKNSEPSSNSRWEEGRTKRQLPQRRRLRRAYTTITAAAAAATFAGHYHYLQPRLLCQRTDKGREDSICTRNNKDWSASYAPLRTASPPPPPPPSLGRGERGGDDGALKLYYLIDKTWRGRGCSSCCCCPSARPNETSTSSKFKGAAPVGQEVFHDIDEEEEEDRASHLYVSLNSHASEVILESWEGEEEEFKEGRRRKVRFGSERIYSSLRFVEGEEEKCLVRKAATEEKMQPPTKRRRTGAMEGLSVAVSSAYVKDILCVMPNEPRDSGRGVPKERGALVSLLDPSNGQTAVVATEKDTRYQVVVNSDRRYVCSIEYPTLEEASSTPSAIWGKRKEEEEEEEDSLVTRNLLNMTSYDGGGNVGGGADADGDDEGDDEDDFEQERDLNFLHMEDGAQMSFDDLGQIYTNISRKRILSKVQCSNIHFHAHSDGSTTIHRHKTCRRNSKVFSEDEEDQQSRKSSHESVDMANLLERMSVARRKEEKRRGRESHPFNDRKDGSSGGEAEEAEEEEEEEDGNGEAKRRESELSNFSKHVENERYKGTLGRIHNFAALQNSSNNDDNDDGNKDRNRMHQNSFGLSHDSLEPSEAETNYASLVYHPRMVEEEEEGRGGGRRKGVRRPVMDMCRCEQEVCEIEGGVKFNPFYVREMRGNGDGNNNDVGSPCRRKGSSDSSADLCDVLLESVVSCAGAAEAHAVGAGCRQCAHFSRRFRRGLAHAVHSEAAADAAAAVLGPAPPPPPQPQLDPVGRQDLVDVERGLNHRHHHQQQPYYYYVPHHPHCRSARAAYRPKLIVQDTKMKLMAYVSVVVLAVLLLVIVVIFLTLFFTQHPAMIAAEEQDIF